MPYYHPLKRMNPAERSRTADNLLRLRALLDSEIPQKTATDTMSLATWNIREFSDNRRTESLYYIAEIVNRFDLVAIQEVAANLAGLEHLLSMLGPSWDYLVTDSTYGIAGGGERMAFVYDRAKISFRKLAGEITLPPDRLIDGKMQLARTPYLVAFQAGWFRFVIATVHIIFGSTSAEGLALRAKEIDTLTSILSKRAKKEDVSYLLLGDFNIPHCEDVTMAALQKVAICRKDRGQDRKTGPELLPLDLAHIPNVRPPAAVGRTENRLFEPIPRKIEVMASHLYFHSSDPNSYATKTVM